MIMNRFPTACAVGQVPKPLPGLKLPFHPRFLTSGALFDREGQTREMIDLLYIDGNGGLK